MPSGGHARSGPAPDPNSLRSQKRNIQLKTLPAAGYQGDPPPWPMSGQAEREAEVWAEVWRSPQATEWISQPYRWLTIGMYVRTFVRCEWATARVADVNALRGLADEIGLTVPGLKLNGWTIEATAPAKTQETTDTPATGNVVDIRNRAKKVAGDGA